jgi:hypothetical protein
MKSRLFLCAAVLFTASYAFAQTPAPAPAPAAPAARPAPPSPPAPGVLVPQPPQPPQTHTGQPINVRIELTISESGSNAPAIKKSVVAVVGDSYSSYVRETGVQDIDTTQPERGRSLSPLNLDARPDILANGKIRLTCTIQYQSSTQRPDQNRRINTDIKQNLVLNLESGKPLMISEATDPITDRKVTVEVTATILK